MTQKTFSFGLSELNLSVERIENDLGYREDDDRQLVTGLIEEALKAAEEFAGVKAEYRIYNEIQFHNANKSLVINNIQFQIEKIVFREIKNSDSMAIFVCTAGEEISKQSRKAMQEGDLLKGYVLDVIGSEIVDSATDLMQSELENVTGAAGKKITNRYSPGYCGWLVSEQHKLFQLMSENYCGISLTHSALMNPVKSISGIIGIGKNVKFNPYTCDLCGLKDCIYRRKVREKDTKV